MSVSLPGTILFIPCEEWSEGTIHRGSNMMRMLGQKYSVVGLERPRNFGAGGLPLRFLRMLWYWARILAYGWRQRRSIDLIFCENTHAAFGGILAKVLGRPCVWDIEAEDALYLNVWRKSRLFSVLILALHGVAKRTADLLLVPCEEDRESYIRRGYLTGERTVTIALSLDFSQFPGGESGGKEELRRSLNLDPNKLVLIYTGQRTELPYREGAEWICRELVPALERVPQDVQIILTGRGEAIRGASSRVTFTGFVPNIYDYIRASDICLAPIWREVGVPGKVFEYMALGKPAVVSAHVRGLRHLTDGWDAMVAATPEDFIRKVIYLVQNPEKAQQIGVRAKETARRCHSYEAVAPQLWRVVEETVARHRDNGSSGGVIHERRAKASGRPASNSVDLRPQRRREHSACAPEDPPVGR